MIPYKKLVSTVGLSHEDWLKYRKQGIGGSDAGAILGFNKYKSPHAVYIDKTTDYVEDLSENEAVYWGTVLENIVAKEFEKRTGKKVQRVNAVLQSIEHPFMLANLDRAIVGENAILECKTANQYLLPDWDGEEIPAAYIWQCQHYMAVTGADVCYIACLVGGQKFVHKPIMRDEKLIQYLIEKEAEFWEFNVLANEPPLLTGMECDSDYVKREFPQDDGECVMLTSGVILAAERYLELCDSEKEIKLKKEQCANEIKAFMEEAETGFCDTMKVSWKTVNSQRLDTTLLKKECPEIYEKYSNISSSRRFTIKEVS